MGQEHSCVVPPPVQYVSAPGAPPPPSAVPTADSYYAPPTTAYYTPPAQPAYYAPPAQPAYYAPPAQPAYYTPPAQPAVTVVSSDPYGHHHHHQAQVTSYTVSTTAPGAPPSSTAAGASTVTVVRGAHGGAAVITTTPAPAPAVVMGPAAIDSLAFGGILHQLEHAPFTADKRAVLEGAWRSYYFTAQQIGDLVNHVPFAEGKKMVAQYFYPRCVDRYNYEAYVIQRLFHFDAIEVRKALGL